MFKINLAKLLKGYKPGEWIGISSDFKSVIVNGRSLKEAMEKAKKIGVKAYYFPVEKSYGDFIGLIIHEN